MTEIQKAANADISIRSYMSVVREEERKLLALRIRDAMRDEKSLATKQCIKRLRRYLNLARTVEDMHNKSTKLYKLSTIMLILNSEPEAFEESNRIIDKIEIHSYLTKEGIARTAAMKASVSEDAVFESMKVQKSSEDNIPEEYKDDEEYKKLVKLASEYRARRDVNVMHLETEVNLEAIEALRVVPAITEEEQNNSEEPVSLEAVTDLEDAYSLIETPEQKEERLKKEKEETNGENNG